MATKKKTTAPKKTAAANNDGVKPRYEGELTGNSKRNRPAFYYKLSEKDHPTIIQGLQRFVSLYQIAAKIGCGYSTLKKYLAEHPALRAVQLDAQEGEIEFVKGKMMQKISEGSLGAICFYLERRAGWTNHQTIDTNMPMPNIVLGMIPESELPDDGQGEPEKLEPVQKMAQKDTSGKLERETPSPLPAVQQEDEPEPDEPADIVAGAIDDGWGDDDAPSGLF